MPRAARREGVFMATKKDQLPIRHLTVLQLKKNLELPSQALKEPGGLKKVELKPTFGLYAELFIRSPRRSTPPWVLFIEEGTSESLPDLANTSTAAVLFIRTGDDLLAYCFGRGRAFLRPDSIDFNFGLRVALNAVDPEKLRSLDSRAFEQMTFQTRRQASRATALQSFGFDVTSDLLRSVTGEPRDTNLAVRLTGRDALVLDARVQFADLQLQAEKLVDLRESITYRKDFDWVDDLQVVKAPAVVDALQQNLVERLRGGDTTGMHFATPGVIEYEDVVGYTFSVESDHKMRSDPEVSDYLHALRHGATSVNLAMLKRHQIELRIADYEEPVSTWQVYKGLVVETEFEGRAYVLSEGEWYVVANSLSDAVRTFMVAFEHSTTSLPAASPDENEPAYNVRAAMELQFVLADRQTVKPAGARTPMEFCDLLSPSKQIIHVKARTSSSTLSHLFAQAFASAEAFLYDHKFRAEVRNKLGNGVSTIIPVQQPKPQEYEIIFAVIGGPTKDWPHSLPFLSRLNFRNTVNRLRRFGYRVSLTHVVRNET